MGFLLLFLFLVGNKIKSAIALLFNTFTVGFHDPQNTGIAWFYSDQWWKQWNSRTHWTFNVFSLWKKTFDSVFFFNLFQETTHFLLRISKLDVRSWYYRFLLFPVELNFRVASYLKKKPISNRKVNLFVKETQSFWFSFFCF